MSSRPCRLAARVVFGFASALVPIAAYSAASFKAVWFPNGNIDYYIADDAEGARDVITDTMVYMAEHTPLEIVEVSRSSDANLRFEATWVSPNGGGYTYGYWDEVRDDSNQKIRFDPNHLPGRTTIAHEFGHALGRPHEFQRDDRDNHVSVCFNVDPFNYSPLGSVYWPDPYYNLSPYDYASVMNEGYSSCVDPLPGANEQSRDYEGVENLLSVHDINGVYRMYGEALGANDDGDRFGVAVASGDYDDDGHKDVAVANVQQGGLWLSFYRGVGTDNSEDVTGLKWMPWFKVQHDGDDVADDAQVTLATGDFNGDGIDDLAVGEPGYRGNVGRVSLLFVNSLRTDPNKDSFDNDFAPWGRKGIQYRIDIDPEDVGFSTFGSWPRFGAALAAVRATNYRNDDGDALYHDLAIGAPSAGGSFDAVDPVAKGAFVIVKGRVDTSPADFSVGTYVKVWNPSSTVVDFAAALAPVPGLCALSGQSSKYYNDYLAVGSPGYSGGNGSVRVYGCATSGTGSSLVTPALLQTYTNTNAGGRFGHALAGFRVYTGSRNSYVAIGQPDYKGSDGKRSGRVVINRVTSSGTFVFVEDFVPSTHDGNDDFGWALAVQQRPYSDSITDEGGRETYIGIGMPGAKVDGVRAGKVYVWRPWNSDGSLHTSAHVIEAYNPQASTDTRFGASIATLRPLKDEGGFVAGAPEAITTEDDVEAGQVSTLQNGAGSYDWETIRRNLNQETEGDKRASNR
jgi:hypothetical protein